jgi:hypothetical protein
VQGAEVTGFLVASQVVMTATSVVADATARGCGLQVRLADRWYGTISAKAWYDAGSKARGPLAKPVMASDPDVGKRHV